MRHAIFARASKKQSRSMNYPAQVGDGTLVRAVTSARQYSGAQSARSNKLKDEAVAYFKRIAEYYPHDHYVSVATAHAASELDDLTLEQRSHGEPMYTTYVRRMVILVPLVERVGQVEWKLEQLTPLRFDAADMEGMLRSVEERLRKAWQHYQRQHRYLDMIMPVLLDDDEEIPF